MITAAIILGVLYLVGVAGYWLFAGAMLLASLEPDAALAFRRRFRSRPVRDTFAWPLRAVRYHATIRKAAMLPFMYLFSVGTIGCFMRKPLPPLSVGCGDGYLLNSAAGRGRNADGTEAKPYPLPPIPGVPFERYTPGQLADLLEEAMNEEATNAVS